MPKKTKAFLFCVWWHWLLHHLRPLAFLATASARNNASLVCCDCGIKRLPACLLQVGVLLTRSRHFLHDNIILCAHACLIRQQEKYLFLYIVTRSSATAEKQRVSCLHGPTWRGARPSSPLPSAPSGYTHAYGRIRKPQRTYVKRAVH